MDFKLLGSILLVVGTSIGAGMLALPIAAAQLGFVGSVLLLCVCWFVMTAGALLLLEVNLWLPQNNNLITMAKATIGPLGQIIAWVMYLLLLYSLICAYIAGGSDLLHNLLLRNNLSIPLWSSAIIFTLIFGSIVYFGIRSVDYANRGLMVFKFGSYFVLIFLLTPYISLEKLSFSDWSGLTSTAAITVTITSFGFGAIVPSLRVYFAGNVKKLKQAIVIGSLIPLFCYIAWDAAIMGVIPVVGENGLMAMMGSKSSTSDLVNTLSATASTESINFFVKLFTSVCVLTSFLAVSLGMTDFLADGFRLEKKGISAFFIHMVAFIPPLTVVLFFPNAFIKALEYAGIYCIVLQILLPAWMVWHGRYHRNLAKNYKVPGGKVLLAFMLVFAIILITHSVFK
jgi:tyrosine-specific transport protein